jgi:hypothetical protein
MLNLAVQIVTTGLYGDNYINNECVRRRSAGCLVSFNTGLRAGLKVLGQVMLATWLVHDSCILMKCALLTHRVVCAKAETACLCEKHRYGCTRPHVVTPPNDIPVTM